MKFEPGSAWNTAPSDELLIQSCAQASRPRSTSGMALTICTVSKRMPSSLRVSVAFCEAKLNPEPAAGEIGLAEKPGVWKSCTCNAA